ncbi:hydroxymethylglutaryl-CoA reductase [Bifidobacterium commune]|uniref:3-hydroxy-3-methylglutaryl coenzyme A reductase n=1 Tax=Bifidobacterium commune TaxID=1505727 RepID=A0A1C4H5Q7_9BIFI|nr:hydroxymethylglutaryl-CoA reductase, degradative [Bifidobacterium commune]MBB2955647.1 hydroxymethylglutaryl-CoA reductase [Bifidobacterium commune]SCC79950.1 3-hydroxy-3-methylglutaryl-coenzyme A reductase [Bifidobacterium commune]
MTKFYELSTVERIDQLRSEGAIDEDDARLCCDEPALPTPIAANMVENQIGNFPVPLGLADHFVIDDEALRVPMAVEEPSVIAAAGNAAQRIALSGGFRTSVRRDGVPAQIVFSACNRADFNRLSNFVSERQDDIRQVAHDSHPSLETHGGGLRKSGVSWNEEGFAQIDLLIDPGDAMGANVVNTISEAVAEYCVAQLEGLDLLMAILSNEAGSQRARSEARINFDNLLARDMDGQTVARRIAAAARFAEVSSQRAATHNKGIMNGINAVVLATGNDTRNMNAAAYADLSAERRTWTTWSIDEERRQLIGSIDLPLPLGSVGGAMSTLPMAKLSLKLLHHPDAARLMGIVASAGLASNLSAMRALVTKGIQAGHMNLQFKSLAMSAGAEPDELDPVVAKLRTDPARANLSIAQRCLRQLRENAKQ